jgi:hypothetical protein
MQHSVINPAVLYWGTPVVLITTTNPDLTSNIAHMSSAFWVGHRCILGLGTCSQTTQNLLRTGECVLNLASDNMADASNSLSHTTGTPIPEYKLQRGYRNEKTNGPPRSSRLKDPTPSVRHGYATKSRWKRRCAEPLNKSKWYFPEPLTYRVDNAFRNLNHETPRPHTFQRQQNL